MNKINDDQVRSYSPVTNDNEGHMIIIDSNMIGAPCSQVLSPNILSTRTNKSIMSSR